MQLNVLAAAIVLLGGLIAACFRGLFRFSIPALAGIFSGATTNTPSLAAAQAVLQGSKDQPSNSTDLLGMAYAVAYPFGIIGIILTMLLIKKVFNVDEAASRTTRHPGPVPTDHRGYQDSTRGADMVAVEGLAPSSDDSYRGNLNQERRIYAGRGEDESAGWSF